MFLLVETVESVYVRMKQELDVNYTNDDIVEHILDEICNNYKPFHTNSVCELVLETHQFLKERTFTHDIVIVIIAVATKALKINLNIYQCGGNKVQFVQKPCLLASNQDIFLKYDQLGGHFHGFDLLTGIWKRLTWLPCWPPRG